MNIILRQNLSLLFLFASLNFISGCAGLKADRGEKKFVIEKSWARNTLQKEYLGARVNHVMEPVLFSNLVIQGNEIDGITAYDRITGQKKWNRKIIGGVTSAAKVEAGLIYFGAGDGFFYALDATSGFTKWSFPIKSEGIGAPVIESGVVYLLAGNNAAYALKAASGEQLWFYSRMDSASITVRGASEPSVSENRVYAGFSDGYLVALDKTKGTLIWEKELGSSVRFRDVDSKPVIEAQRIYVSSYDGQLYCLNLANGQTIWTNDEGGFTPVTISGNSLYYSTSTQKVISLDKHSGKLLWSKPLSKTVASQPLVYRGLVLFGEWSGQLRVLEERTGEDVTQFNTGRGVTSVPALEAKSGYIYVMTADANLFALKLLLKNQRAGWTWEN